MRRAFVCLLALTLSGPVLSRPKLPKNLAWAAEAMEATTQTEPGDAAVVLLDELTITPLNATGKVRKRRRTLLKILSSEGLAAQFQPIYYNRDGRLAWYRAWTIRPDGSVQEVDKRQVVDQGLSTYKMFEDVRRVVLPMPNVGVGSYVAVEYSLQHPAEFPQQLLSLQWSYPVARSRVILELPNGWAHEATFRNTQPQEPRKEGNQLIWEFESLPGLPGHDYAVSASDASVSLAVTYFPEAQPQPFDDWLDVATWEDERYKSQAVADEPMRAAVKKLTAPGDPLQSISAYVQELRYVHVSLGKSGHTPYPATEVFKERYGDCKDKATLMMTMLREAGIPSHPIMVSTRDSGRVDASFPSPPGHFNHVVLGIPVPADAGFEAMTQHPQLGAVLVFDPTDEQTPLGDLPWSDQGTQGLLVHPEFGDLLELPVIPAAGNLAERDWTLKLGPRGAATATLSGRFTGQYARAMRGWLGGKNEAQRTDEITAALSGRVPGARIAQMTAKGLDDPAQAVELQVELDVARFSRVAGPMRIAEPMKFVQSLAPDLSADPGGLPVLLRFQFREIDRFHVELPEHWQLSEPPEGLSTETEFGQLTFSLSGEGTRWELKRELVVETLEVPLESYAAARTFFDEARQVLATPVVLERTQP